MTSREHWVRGLATVQMGSQFTAENAENAEILKEKRRRFSWKPKKHASQRSLRPLRCIVDGPRTVAPPLRSPGKTWKPARSGRAGRFTRARSGRPPPAPTNSWTNHRTCFPAFCTIYLYLNNVNTGDNSFNVILPHLCHNLSYFGSDICHNFLTCRVTVQLVVHCAPQRHRDHRDFARKNDAGSAKNLTINARCVRCASVVQTGWLTERLL